MTATRDEITINIGNLIGQSANSGGQSWDYAGYVFATNNGESSSSSFFVFRNSKLLDIDDDDRFEETERNFFRLREITRVDGDDYWIRCLAVVQNASKQFKMLFEFDDPSRWQITPANAHDSFRILVGEIFPDSLN